MQKIKQSLFFILISFVTYSQSFEVTGVVYDENKTPLPGATIVIKNSNIGTTTDFDGNFILNAKENEVIEISYVGYTPQSFVAKENLSLEIFLVSNNTLDEVVITALGIKRQEKAVGYSVQSIKASEINKVKSSNVLNSLNGKLSGVQITGSSAGPSASSNITIRGVSSLTGNNQALIIVNGMPITNELYSFDDGLNGSTTIDFGNAAQIINSDDIETVSVLKGPAASALYGSRAANGVVLIETKKGSFEKKSSFEINSSLTFSNPLKLPDYQNKYGSGGGGKYSYLNGSTYIGADQNYDAYGENWGPQLDIDGQLIKQFNSNGNPAPWTSSPNNIKNFYNTSVNITNNVSYNSYNDSNNFSRFSYTNLNNEGLIPNTDLERNTFYSSLNRSLFNNKLKVSFSNMFVRSTSDNIPNSGYDESSSVMYGWLWYPRQVDINDLKDYWQPGKEGIQQRYVENLWVNNPWFIVNENTNAFKSNRLISTLELNYEVFKDLNVRFKYGSDYLNESRNYRRAPSTKGVLNGSYREDRISFNETNAELLISYSPSKINSQFLNFDLKLGGNLMKQEADFSVANNPELQLFGTGNAIYTLSNSRSGVLSESQKTNSKVNSVFGVLSSSFLNKVYFDVTLRNDWASSLVNPLVGKDQSNYSYSYPSFSSSFLLHEIFNMPIEIDFFKLRASYAEVGNGAPSYSFGNTFTPKEPFGTNPVFTTKRQITDPNLKNESTHAREIGLDIRTFGGKLNLDLAYYHMNSFNQIISLPTAITSGYDSYLTNGGEISNKGIEASLNFNTSLFNNLKWSSTINFTRNRAIVESLPDVIKSGQYSIIADIFPGDEGGSDLEFVAKEGQLYGQLVGLGFQRAPDGGIIHEDGLPLITSEKVSAGSYQPDFTYGWYNSFQHKGFELGFLIGGQVGGKIYSRSHALYATGGAITNNDDPNLNLSTMQGRTVYSVSYDSSGKPIYTLVNQGGVIGPGYMYNSNGQLVKNNVTVPAGGAGYVGYFYNYYGNGFNRDNIEAATYDATFIKLREVSLSYNLPKKISEKLNMQNISVSIIGKNLILISDVPTIDPETFSIRNGLFVKGFESTSIPTQSSYGVGINLKF